MTTSPGTWKPGGGRIQCYTGDHESIRIHQFDLVETADYTCVDNGERVLSVVSGTDGEFWRDK